jgi:hypothetical protein
MCQAEKNKVVIIDIFFGVHTDVIPFFDIRIFLGSFLQKQNFYFRKHILRYSIGTIGGVKFHQLLSMS